MSILSFEIQADYSEAIRLREEIDRLQRTLNSMGPGTSVQTIQSVQESLDAARSRFSALAAAAAQSGSAVEANAKMMTSAIDTLRMMSKQGIADASTGKSIADITENMRALRDMIENTEASIRSHQNRLAAMGEQMRTSLSEGNDKAAQMIARTITAKTEEIAGLRAEADEYRNVLATLEKQAGLDTQTGVTRTKYFESENDWGKAMAISDHRDSLLYHERETAKELEDVQAQLNNVNLTQQQIDALLQKATDLGVELERTRNRIREDDEELGRLNASAEKAADALGKSGDKAAQMSQRLYESNARVREQEESIKDLRARLDEAREARKQAFDAGDDALVKRYDSEMDALNKTIENGTAALREYQAAQRDAKSEMSEFMTKTYGPMFFSNPNDWQRERELTDRSGALTQDANSLRTRENDMMSQIDQSGPSNPALQQMQDELANVRQSLADTESSISQTNTELDELRQKGLAAAASLGTELGGKASEASAKVYELQSSIQSKNQEIRTLNESIEQWKSQMADAQSEMEKINSQPVVTPGERQRLQDLSSAVEDFKSKISEAEKDIDNASNSVKRMESDLGDARNAFDKVNDAVRQHDNVLVKMMGGTENYSRILGMMPAPIQNVISGIVGMKNASLAFLATPLGMVLGVVAMALASVHKWLNSTVAGQMEMAKISGYVSGVLGVLANIAVKVGNAIYDAVTHPIDSIKKLGNAIWDGIVNRLKAIPETLNAIADMVGHIVKGEFAEAKKGFSDFVNGLLKMGTGVDDAIGKMDRLKDSVIDTVKEIHEAGRAMSEVESDMRKLKFDRATWDIEKNQMSEEKARLMAIARDNGKSASERQKALDRMTEISSKINEKEQELLEREINAKKASILYSPTSIEDETEYNALLARRAGLDAQKAQAAASMQRLKNMVRRAGEGEAKFSKNQAYQLGKISKEEMDRLDKEQREVDMLIEDLRIKRMKESTDREIAEAKQQAKRKMNALEDQAKAEAKKLIELDRKEWISSGGDSRHKRAEADWVQTKSDDEYLAQAKENIGFQTQSDIIAEDEAKAVKKATDEADMAMRGYIRKYGSYAEKLNAINEDFEHRIGEARTEGDRMALREEWEDAKNALRDTSDDFIRSIMDVSATLDDLARRQAEEMNLARQRGASGVELAAITDRYRRERENAVTNGIGLDKDIDGVAVQESMTMLGSMQKEALERLRSQIQVYAEAYADNLGADGQAKIRDMMQRIDEAIESRGAKWKAFIGGIPAVIDDFRRSQEKLTKARLAYEDAHNKSLAAEERKEKGRERLVNAIQDKAGMDRKEAEKSVDAGTVTQDLAGKVDENVMKEIEEAAQSFSEASSAAAEAGAEATGAAEAVGEAQAGADAFGAAMADKIIHQVNMNLQSVPELLDQLGLSDTAFGKGMKDFAESSQYATQAFDELKRGNFVGVATNLVNAFGSLGNTIGHWFGGGLFGESDARLADDMERLAQSNTDLRRSIDMLADDMKDASTAESLTIYRKQRENLMELSDKTQELMSRAGKAYNNGFLGIGGKGSSNKRINREMSASDWAAVSRAAETSVRSASEFWSLTSEQMARVAKDATAQWTTIKMYADDGYADASQFMDEYITFHEQLEQLTDAINEKATDTTFDSVQDSFKSMLLDMESDTQDFTDSFEEMMRSAVMNSMMDTLFNDRLKTWYENFSKYMQEDSADGGVFLTAAHQDLLRAEYEAIAKEAVDTRDILADALDWDVSISQKGARSSFSGMSESQGDAIEGRLTSMLMYVAQIQSSHTSETASLASLSNSAVEMMQRAAEDSRIYNEILICANRCYIELAGIQENTGAVVDPIREMASNIADMQKKLKTL